MFLIWQRFHWELKIIPIWPWLNGSGWLYLQPKKQLCLQNKKPATFVCNKNKAKTRPLTKALSATKTQSFFAAKTNKKRDLCLQQKKRNILSFLENNWLSWIHWLCCTVMHWWLNNNNNINKNEHSKLNEFPVSKWKGDR